MWCTARFWNNLLQARSNDFNKKYFYCLIKVLLGKKHEFCHYNKVLKIICITTETIELCGFFFLIRFFYFNFFTGAIVVMIIIIIYDTILCDKVCQ
jgi:hypothetical protein